MVKITDAEEGFISMGPWGGQQGEPWAYKPDGRITEIIVRHREAIDTLIFKSESCDGFPLEYSQKFGGRGGNQTDKVCIDGIEEYLSTISMTFGEFDGVSGTFVSIPMEGGVIFGFHGRAGKYLNAIGIYVAPKSTSSCQIGSQLSAPTHPKTPSSMNLLVQRDPGPWGAQRGRHWDDGVFLAIKQVNILLTGSEYGHTFQGIRFKYEQRDGSSFISPWHGNLSGGTASKRPFCSLSGVTEQLMELDSEGEIIVGIEGFYGPVKGTDGFEVITSISIYTNKRKFGPFGENERGTHFSSTLSGGKVIGFFGRSGTYLNAIGVHTEYC